MAREIAMPSGHVAVVDAADYDRVAGYRWHVKRARLTNYAMAHLPWRNGKRPCLYLHRVILDAPPDVEVDHEDHNGLNCTRRNLRLATVSQNNRNARKARGGSGYIGVTQPPEYRRWVATYLGKRIGVFETPIQAALARDAAIIAAGDTFSILNFPEVCA